MVKLRVCLFKHWREWLSIAMGSAVMAVGGCGAGYVDWANGGEGLGKSMDVIWRGE